MLRAIELGKNAIGSAAPNPAVGCVIVHDKKIIGEGYTSEYGGNHAEVNAIASVKDKSLLRKATLYVTLEPCSHFGKTPPCADFIIENQIKKVAIGLQDPHHKVAGQGIKKLKEAGCEVLVGILESECREHHKRFLTYHKKKRPYIILKWAKTVDGFIAPEDSTRQKDAQPYWITNTYSRQLVHQWRSQEQAILVGTETVLKDNPKLNVRDWSGNNPIRVVLDRQLRIPNSYHVFDGSVKTIILTENSEQNPSKENIQYEILGFDKQMAEQICEILCRHNIASVIIEGGAQTLQAFIDANLWDEARVFTGTTTFKKGIKAPNITGKVIEKKNSIDDILIVLEND